MARAHSVYLVQLNHRPIRAFTVKHECASYLERAWPKCPENLRVLRIPDGRPRGHKLPADIIDITADLYGLKG